jgi:hypothetical protein
MTVCYRDSRACRAALALTGIQRFRSSSRVADRRASSTSRFAAVRAIRLQRSTNCQATEDITQFYTAEYIPKTQANAGIDINLVRLTLNSRSISTSFISSAITSADSPQAAWWLATR